MKGRGMHSCSSDRHYREDLACTVLKLGVPWEKYRKCLNYMRNYQLLKRALLHEVPYL
jgi:hypothetical protein